MFNNIFNLLYIQLFNLASFLKKIIFIEICEHLYQHFVLKMKIKEENTDSINNLDLQAMLNRPKSTVMQSVTLSNTPPPGIVTPGTQGIQFLNLTDIVY